jgi:hypothetical protein
MRRITSWLAGPWPLILLATVNVGLLVAYGFLSSRASVYHRGGYFPAVSGIALDGGRFVAAPSPCYVLRLTADDCLYCQRDQPRYSQVVRAAHGIGCQVVAVAPQAGQMAPAPGGGAHQLKFVEMELGDSLYPYLTPQTILLDGNRRVVWQHQGALNDRALTAGVAAIDGIRGRAARSATAQ